MRLLDLTFHVKSVNIYVCEGAGCGWAWGAGCAACAGCAGCALGGAWCSAGVLLLGLTGSAASRDGRSRSEARRRAPPMKLK